MYQPSVRRETRYGMPAADQVIYNRHYIVGYSYYFRQAKWALEIVSPESEDVEREDAFRPDYRIPEIFRADLEDFSNSGYDRGHLIPSANKLETEIQNSETFLLSNMSPQNPSFNRGIWKELETRVRELNDKKNILETYVICGPIFDFEKSVSVIGKGGKNEVTLPIPHSYFKSVLTENNRGKIKMWSFIIPNKKTNKELTDFQASANFVEKMSGLLLWENLVGTSVEKMKNKVYKLWK